MGGCGGGGRGGLFVIKKCLVCVDNSSLEAVVWVCKNMSAKANVAQESTISHYES